MVQLLSGWNEGKATACLTMATLVMVLCSLFGVSMQGFTVYPEDILLKLYYLYERSPKKCRELHCIVGDLKEVFELPDSGNLPVRSQGSQWISHKRNALQQVINRYGAYLCHLTALIEDKTIKCTDRQMVLQHSSVGNPYVGIKLNTSYSMPM